MRELGLISKQPGPPAYKQTKVEQPDIPNQLNRGFTVSAPNQVWCGDITYIWEQGRWHYLAAVQDLYTSLVISMALSAKQDAGLFTIALDLAYVQRGRPSGVLFHSFQGVLFLSRTFRQQLRRYLMQQS